MIPVVTYDSAGNQQPLRAENEERKTADKSELKKTDGTLTKTNPSKELSSKDSLSVLGVFSTDTSAQTRTVGIGKFFATGAAAQRLAEGFSLCLAVNGCSGAATPAANDRTVASQNSAAK